MTEDNNVAATLEEEHNDVSEEKLDASISSDAVSATSTSSSSSSTTPPPPPTESSPGSSSSNNSKNKSNLAILSRLFFPSCNNNNNNNKQTATTDHPLLDDAVDHVVASSAEEAQTVLRGMVADLLRENDTLTQQLQTTQTQLSETQHERNLLRDEYQEQLRELHQTVERAMPTSAGAAADNNTKNHEIKKKEEVLLLLPDSSSTTTMTTPILSPAQATELLIQSLSRKVEDLHSHNTVLEQELLWTRDRMEDLESLNDARLHTIDALESLLCRHKRNPHRSAGTTSSSSNSRPALLTLTNHQHDPMSSPTTAFVTTKTTTGSDTSPQMTAPTLLESPFSDRGTWETFTAEDSAIFLSPGMGEI